MKRAILMLIGLLVLGLCCPYGPRTARSAEIYATQIYAPRYVGYSYPQVSYPVNPGYSIYGSSYPSYYATSYPQVSYPAAVSYPVSYQQQTVNYQSVSMRQNVTVNNYYCKGRRVSQREE